MAKESWPNVNIIPEKKCKQGPFIIIIIIIIYLFISGMGLAPAIENDDR